MRYKQLCKTVIPCVLCLGIGLNASVVVEDIKAQLRKDYRVKIDGKELQLNDKFPINYNGTTYLPIRAIGEAVDKDVSFTSTNKTIELNTKKKDNSELIKKMFSEQSHTSVKLTDNADIAEIGKYAVHFTEVNRTSGDKYGIINLNRQFDTVNGVIKNFGNDVVNATITDDKGNVVYKTTLTPNVFEVFNLNVEYVDQLKISVVNDKADNTTSVAFMNFNFN